jgi:hypothetical protein
MIAWVSGVVRVMAGDLRRGDRAVRNENGTGGSSPGCISSDGPIDGRPSSRGGVPVLSRPIAKPRP